MENYKNKGVYRTNELLYDSLKDNFNKITFGDPSRVDINKQNLLPLCHISITGITNTRNSKTISYQIFIFDIVDENDLDPNDMKNDFRLTSNIEDIIHDLDQRFVRSWFNFKDLLEEAPDSVSMDILYGEGYNNLIGYEINFDITLEQNGMC